MVNDTSLVWLVAEDSDDDFVLLQRACRRLKPVPTLRRAKDGLEAQEYLAKDGPFNDRSAYPLPSLVVSDLNMPRVDGLHLLAWCKGQASSNGIPFILLTSSDKQEHVDQARASGADNYFLKSASYERLVSTLAQISRRI
jgi:CheY-like chemotaxis protein